MPQITTSNTKIAPYLKILQTCTVGETTIVTLCFIYRKSKKNILCIISKYIQILNNIFLC
ncbi:hypothetical protein BpHYR1_013040 [Brachionus plicatilis]|uniref:Uncharacterized protein n=1 Tax=Brachionus plicatilis TaxID=10195 RepID=A0A3M7SIA9_BRAPC|nr:hypothetical protein BpHYR1_013040 [Brachionus plicatilis]